MGSEAQVIAAILLLTIVSPAVTDYGDLRISDGAKSAGRLEFQERDGTWGTVCSYGFSHHAAGVACRQLEYDSGHVLNHQNYPPDNLTIAICYTSCDGDEDELINCNITLCGNQITPYCTDHSDDVSVSCFNNDDDEEDHTTVIVLSVIGGIVLAGIGIAAITTVLCLKISVCPCYHCMHSKYQKLSGKTTTLNGSTSNNNTEGDHNSILNDSLRTLIN